MPTHDYRRVLRVNLKAALAHHGLNRNTIKAYYLSGTKKGKRLSGRAIGYMLDGRQDAPSPSLDTMAAVSHALGLELDSAAYVCPPGERYCLTPRKNVAILRFIFRSTANPTGAFR